MIAKRIKTDCYNFFEFPKASKGPDEKKRRDAWINFCKGKSFCLTFSSDTYVIANSPEFLKSIEFTGRRRYLLKDDAVPTENKPLPATHERQNPKRSAGTFSRLRVRTNV